jgi:hypothetical protein
MSIPIQGFLVIFFIRQQVACVQATDKRVRLSTEVLQGIRLIKAYAWEEFYQRQIGVYRGREIDALKGQAVIRSVFLMLMTFMPVLASVLSFVSICFFKSKTQIVTEHLE